MASIGLEPEEITDRVKDPAWSLPRNRPGPRHSASERPAARSLLVRLQPWAGDLAQPFAIRRQDSVIVRHV